MTFMTDEALQSYLLSIDNELDLTLSLSTWSVSNINGRGFYGIPVMNKQN